MTISDEHAARITAARVDARSLGYTLFVDEALNIEPLTHMAFAAPYLGSQGSNGRFLTYSTSAAAAAEAGVEMLRGIVERGNPWPQSS